MAIVYDGRWYAHDSNGNPISGATLTIYTAGTTTPASIYRDAALTVPMSNPTSGADKADSAGRFPQIYAAEGAIFDILEKDAGGSTVASYLSVVSLGSSTGSLSRDFTNSRFQARGSGGVVFIEAGDPLGDDVGGTMTIGGWNGTQADLVTINAALVNIVGRLKENSYKIPGVVRSEAVSFSAATNIDIPLTNDPTGAIVWDIDIWPFKLSATGVGVTVRFSYDGGGTYVSTSTYYSILTLAQQAGTPAETTIQTAATSGQILSAANTTSPVSIAGMMKLRVGTPNSGSDSTTVMGEAITFGSAGNLETTRFGVANTTGGRATHMRLTIGSGNATGIYRVSPQRGFGEV